MRLAYGDLIGGVSGDMFVAALLDLGLSLNKLKAELKKIPTLKFEIQLETFGTPVEGAVRLELLDNGARVAEATADAKAGVVKSSFPLTGKGPHAINVQLKEDASKTASVPIVGSREAERSPTTFSLVRPGPGHCVCFWYTSSIMCAAIRPSRRPGMMKTCAMYRRGMIRSPGNSPPKTKNSR